jgi:SAM-dependent methyltransferase
MAWPNARFFGIDLAAGLLAEAKRKHSGDARFRFEVAGTARFSLEPASIDVAFSRISLHHWGDQLGGVRQVARVARPSGLFVLADFRPPLLLRPLLRRFHAQRSRRRLFEDAGLSVVDQRQPPRLSGQVLIMVSERDRAPIPAA